MTDYPQDPIDFQQAWSQCAGRTSGFSFGIKLLEERAANLFIQRGHDDAAEILREMAHHLKRAKEAEERDLEGFIKEAQNRNAELRRKQPGHPGIPIRRQQEEK